MAPNPASRKVRLDQLLVERGLVQSRARAQRMIMAGRVFSGRQRLDKAGCRIDPDTPLSVSEGLRYVSRGGHKLRSALERFGIPVDGLDVLDVGASTGGFTQVLLEAGASRIIALDVGKGQLDWNLRNDPRVFPLEGLNARHLQAEDLPFRPVLAVMDVSFISLRLVLPPVASSLAPDGGIVALVKPQFEVGRGKVGKGGIVRDPGLHREVLEGLSAFCVGQGWRVAGIGVSPIRGAEGNIEFFMHLSICGGDDDQGSLSEMIESALSVSSGMAGKLEE